MDGVDLWMDGLSLLIFLFSWERLTSEAWDLVRSCPPKKIKSEVSRVLERAILQESYRSIKGLLKESRAAFFCHKHLPKCWTGGIC
jgi:hypothetical protein